MIDIGANLSSNKFKKQQIPNVLSDAKSAGVSGIILTTVSEASYLQNLELLQEDSSGLLVGTTWGVHPHYSDTFKNLSKHELSSKVIAIGETGLDYYRMLQPKEVQVSAFEHQIEKANVTELPLFLHERLAHEDFLSILKSNARTKKVVHCFTGNKDQLKAYLNEGCYIGVTGWVADKRRNQDLVEALKYCPVERLMIETDSPYLKPQKAKGDTNVPANLSFVQEAVSKYISHKDLEQILLKNTKDFFGLK